MFFNTLSIITKTWNPNINKERVNKLCSINTIEENSAIKKKQLIYATRMNLQNHYAECKKPDTE